MRYFTKNTTARILIVLLTLVMAQKVNADERPDSPEILRDYRVIFRYEDPSAKSVMIKGIGRTYVEMKRDAKGIWSATVPHIDPGVYDYSFLVDGVQTIDPSNPSVKPDKNPDTSLLEITTNKPLFYQWANIPHGTVHLQSYFSASLKRLRRVRVYTPPGYEHQPAKKYPVLYLLHGTGDTEATWTEFGHAHLIMDNLIAAGKTVPMILVMPDGHADLQEEEGDHIANFVRFEKDLLESVIPLVDSTYQTIKAPSGRAINGLSMGGMQALEIGINHPELFAYVGGMSAYVPEPKKLIARGLVDKNLNQELKLLWISIGKDDFLLKDAEKFHKLLVKHGIHVDWHLTAGSHEWTVWRGYLRDFGPLLFHPSA
jgi:enterochelin esterase-like enzyme